MSCAGGRITNYHPNRYALNPRSSIKSLADSNRKVSALSIPEGIFFISMGAQQQCACFGRESAHTGIAVCRPAIPNRKLKHPKISI
jgi:hypothetical protein